jgi:lysyl-tRNA synthetase class 2
LSSYVDEYGPEGKIPAGTKIDKVTESLAGRIHNIRASGAKLKFYDLHGEGTKVQIMATQQ